MSNRFYNELKKNKLSLIGFYIIIFFILVAILAPVISPYRPDIIFDGMENIKPFTNLSYALGTDDLGRDMLSRLIYGTRISLLIGFFCVSLSLIFGLFIGLVSAFYGGKVDAFFMQIIDIMMSLPSILLAIFIVAILGPSLFNAIIAVGIVSIPSFARIIRSAAMSEVKKTYIKASKSFQSPDYRIMLFEILPNILGPIIVQASFSFSEGILSTAALGFLGLGAQPPTPEWGIMLADARSYLLSAPWTLTMPGLCILIVVLAFNLLGDGLNDFFNPKLKQNKS